MKHWHQDLGRVAEISVQMLHHYMPKHPLMNFPMQWIMIRNTPLEG
jgi:hypothetical protein